VDIPSNTWNQLEQWVFEKWELINGGEKREMGVILNKGGKGKYHMRVIK
jgi:hypothetical protein